MDVSEGRRGSARGEVVMENSPAGVEGLRTMEEMGARRVNPELKDLVVEASRALARLDADRLEELAVSCQALNRALAPGEEAFRAAVSRQAREATAEMAVFAKVLEVTRANLNVLNRLRELRAGRLEYREEQLREWTRTESRHGDN
jgi:hypothetical protein